MINLNQYNWISTDGKTVRPENPCKEIYSPNYNYFERSVLNLVFGCEGLEPGRVYKGEELREVWQWKLHFGSQPFREVEQQVYKRFISFEDLVKHFEGDKDCSFSICIKLKEHPNEEEPVKESVEQAAEKAFPIPNDWAQIDKYVEYSKRHGFHRGAQWQLQNLPIKEILELVCQELETDCHCVEGYCNGVKKQSILSLEEEILKLINNQK